MVSPAELATENAWPGCVSLPSLPLDSKMGPREEVLFHICTWMLARKAFKDTVAPGWDLEVAVATVVSRDSKVWP